MIRRLAFTAERRLSEGRTLRWPRFDPCAQLPLATACDVANALTSRFSALLGSDVTAELIEPIPFHATIHKPLLDGARLFRVVGTSNEAFIVLRVRDERRLARGTFRATDDSLYEVSSIESRVVERLSHAAAHACASLCGTVGSVIEETSRVAASKCLTYFEIRLLRPMRAAVGIAVARDSVADAKPAVKLENLLDIPLRVHVTMGHGDMTLLQLSQLSRGSIVSLATGLQSPSQLCIGGRVMGAVCPGVSEGRLAFRADAPVPAGTA